MTHTCKITWLGHACFKIEALDYTIVIDPFEDQYVPGCDNIRETANQVLCSHEHHDHNARGCVEIIKKESPVKISEIMTYHDDKKGALRGKNVIHLLDDGLYKIAHLGDLGCELELNQIELLKNVDVLLIPVGGYYTINVLQAKKVVEELQPRIVIPMHYRGEGFGFDVISTVEEFTQLFEECTYIDSNYVEIDKNMKHQIIVLKLK